MDNVAVGPFDRGAVNVMGHSMREWLKCYDVKSYAKFTSMLWTLWCSAIFMCNTNVLHLSNKMPSLQ